MRPDALFAYGTLIFPEVFRAVTGRLPESRPGRLAGWAAYGLQGAVYPGLRPAEGSETPGRLYLGIDPPTWARLDAFEGELYRVETLDVECAAGPRSAAVYVVEPDQRHRLSDRPWNPEEFRRGALEGYLESCRRFADAHRAGLP